MACRGAVSRFVVPFFAQHHVQWIASDRGVLAWSGLWDYQGDDPKALCQPFRAEEGEVAISLFFRDTQLSDAISFRYYAYDDPTRRHETCSPRKQLPCSVLQPPSEPCIWPKAATGPGVLTCWFADEQPQSADMLPVGGVMAGVQRYHLTLGPFPLAVHAVPFRSRCTSQDGCCQPDEHIVNMVTPQ